MTQTMHRLQNWGGSDNLDAFETLMWRLDTRPNLRAAVTSIELLDAEPEWDRLISAHEWALAAVPRLRSRILDAPLGIGNAIWQPLDSVDLSQHISRHDLSASGTLRNVLDIAQEFAMQPFDRSRAPWEAMLVTGLENGQAAYILKLHHAMTDGNGIVQLLSGLHSRTREKEPRPALLTQSNAKKMAGSTSALSRVRRAFLSIPTEARKTVSSLQSAASQAIRDPAQLLEDAFRYVGSAQRILAPVANPPSPLLCDRNYQWRFETLDISLPALKSATKYFGVSLNDAFVAGIAKGFSKYHDHFGVHHRALTISFPISLRSASDADGGNKFVPAHIVASMKNIDPLQCMSEIKEQVTAIRSEPALDATLRIMPLLSFLPADLVAEALGTQVASRDIQISNVPGIREEVYLAGCKVLRLYPFAPLPGCAAMITLVSHGDNCCVGLNLDSAAITDPDLLRLYIEDSVDEILAAAIPNRTEIGA